MAKQQRTWGIFITQLALAIYFIVTAFCLITREGASISSTEIEAITEIFGKGAGVVNLIVAIVLLLCGIMFALKAFGMDFDKFDDVFKYVTLVLWIVITVITLILNLGDFKSIMVLHWLLLLSKNALIIGGVLLIKNGK
ncbi:MAG: hypothetical protein J1E59_05015 [Treponema sp.]|nr:hypothetical protein [Treponema sp.]